MSEPDKRTKAIWLAAAVANLAADMLLPTLTWPAVRSTSSSSG
ncbi:hypothetical protein [Nocardia jiangxiensis]|uniref:Uncharacterized protein n=1 Tax=Nocardia jiangxiensis TaxID=282685 RepID=A0ABW6S5A0_9NOCA|nr:hypothetical protein [Nocardia jiangxiensis]